MNWWTMLNENEKKKTHTNWTEFIYFKVKPRIVLKWSNFWNKKKYIKVLTIQCTQNNKKKSHNLWGCIQCFWEYNENALGKWSSVYFNFNIKIKVLLIIFCVCVKAVGKLQRQFVCSECNINLHWTDNQIKCNLYVLYDLTMNDKANDKWLNCKAKKNSSKGNWWIPT